MLVANQHLKRYSASLTIRKVHINTTMRYCFTPTRMDKIKETDNNNCWEETGKLEASCMVGGSMKWYSYCGKHSGSLWKS